MVDNSDFESLKSALDAATGAGVHIVVAATPDNRDECRSSMAPANAITVGASTLGDERAYFSNFGPCIDLFAPGPNVLSTYRGSGTAVAILSGTEIAAAHAAGLVAYLLSQQPNGGVTPEELKKTLVSLETPDALASLPEKSNNLRTKHFLRIVHCR